MRILHAVTLISPDGAYGGPVRVALNQAAELRSRGHSLTVAAGHRGFDVPPTVQGGTPLVLRRAYQVVPKAGFAGIAAPGLIRWLLDARKEFDVAHIHLGRDLVLLPFAHMILRMGIPFVLQPHGMIIPGAHPLAPGLDRLIVRRLLRDAHEVFYLTTQERDALREVAGSTARLTPLPNGVPLYDGAAGTQEVPEVLYLARLDRRKRPVDFVMAALDLNARGIRATYALVGPDQGEAQRVQSLAATTDNVRWEGPVGSGESPARMRRASVYVLPSVGSEPYPMAVLEAMSVGLPVVVTDHCGLAPLVRKYDCGIVISAGAPNVARAIEDLLTAPGAARAMGERGRAAVRQDLGMSHVGTTLERTYVAATSHARRTA